MWGLGLRASSLPAPSSLEGTCAQLAHFLSVTRGPGPPGPVSLCRQCLSPPSLDLVAALTPAVPRSHLGHHQDLDFRLGALHHLPVSSALPRTPVPQPSRTPCWPVWLGSCLEAWASITTHSWVGPASPGGGGRHPWLGVSAPQPSPWQCPHRSRGTEGLAGRPRGAASWLTSLCSKLQFCRGEFAFGTGGKRRHCRKGSRKPDAECPPRPSKPASAGSSYTTPTAASCPQTAARSPTGPGSCGRPRPPGGAGRVGEPPPPALAPGPFPAAPLQLSGGPWPRHVPGGLKSLRLAPS